MPRKLILRSGVTVVTCLMMWFRSLWNWLMGVVWKSLEEWDTESLLAELKSGPDVCIDVSDGNEDCIGNCTKGYPC